MRTKPILFYYLGALFFGLALCFPLQIAYVKDLSINQLHYSISYLSDFNIVTMGTFICISMGFIFGHSITALFLVLSIPLVAINNYFVMKWGYYANSKLPLYMTLIYMSGFFLFIQTKYFRALADNHFKWWRTAQRFEIPLNARLIIDGHIIPLKTINISQTGALLKSLNVSMDIEQFERSLGSEAKLELEFHDDYYNFCSAKLVRINKVNNIDYGAIALQFTEQPLLFQKCLERLIARVDRSLTLSAKKV